MRLGIGSAPAGLALDKAVCAVQFHQTAGRGSGKSVKAVDILRDYGQHFVRAFETHDCVMSGIRARLAKCLPPFQFVIPMLQPRRFRSHKIVVIDRLPLFPHALRPAKIRDAAAG